MESALASDKPKVGVQSFDELASDLAQKLVDYNVVKFGDFKLKSGLLSPVYMDLRGIISEPQLLTSLSQLMVNTIEKVEQGHGSPDVHHKTHIVGIPYAALPMATHVSHILNRSMLMKRKEAKSYGTKQLIEGRYERGDSCVIIEDVITSGASILEVVQELRNEGLNVSYGIVCVDREQGGLENLRKHGIHVHSLFTVSSILSLLSQRDPLKYREWQIRWAEFTQQNQVSIPSEVILEDCVNQSLELRGERATHPLLRRLFTTMRTKHSNLCVAVDVRNKEDLFLWAERLAPHICMLKTHTDLLDDFQLEDGLRLRHLAEEKDFLLFEDRKFGDIGETVRGQLEGGTSRVCQWCHVVTCHAVPGPSVLQGVQAAAGGDVGVLLVAQMSTQDSFRSEEYSQLCHKMATAYPQLVMGFITQSRFTPRHEDWLCCTPGVKILNETETIGKDALGQRYRGPREAIVRDLCDVAIVGRGITQDAILQDGRWDETVVIRYKEALFHCLQDRSHGGKCTQ